MYRLLFIHASGDGHLSHFQFMTSCEQSSCEVSPLGSVCSLWGQGNKYVGVGLLARELRIFLVPECDPTRTDL